MDDRVKAFRERRAARLKARADAGDWDESKHPRDKDGRFGSGSGGSEKESEKKKSGGVNENKVRTESFNSKAKELLSDGKFGYDQSEKVSNLVDGMKAGDTIRTVDERTGEEQIWEKADKPYFQDRNWTMLNRPNVYLSNDSLKRSIFENTFYGKNTPEFGRSEDYKPEPKKNEAKPVKREVSSESGVRIPKASNQERHANAVHAMGNKWASENWRTTH